MGQNARELDMGEDISYSGVRILNEEDEIVGTAGTEDGAVLEFVHPDGDARMADLVWRSIQGKTMTPFEARDVLLDPAAEPGDGVKLGGMYGTLVSFSTTHDRQYISDIGSPDAGEIEDELPKADPESRLERKIAGTRSQFTKTANKIAMEVFGDPEDPEKPGLKTWVSLQIAEASLGVETPESSNVLLISADGTLFKLNADGSETETFISGGSLDTDTVIASSLRAKDDGKIRFYTKRGYEVGYFDLNDYALPGFQSFIIGADENDVIISSGLVNKSSIQLSHGKNGDIKLGAADKIHLNAENAVLCKSLFRPNSRAEYDLGNRDYPWRDLYLEANSTITSDREKKKDIAEDLDWYSSVFDRLKPVSYKLKSGTSDRTHLGLIAQDVEEALEACGIDSKDFAGFVKAPKEDGTGYDYFLRYGEFIAPIIFELQKAKRELMKLKTELQEMKRRLDALEGG